MDNIFQKIKNYKLYKNRKMNIVKIAEKSKSQAEVTRLVKNKVVKFKNGTANSGSGCIAGDILTIASCTGSLQAPYYGVYIVHTKTGRQFSIYGCEIELPAVTISELEEANTSIENTIEELKAEIAANTSKISFMKENKLKDFDEDAFKVYAVLDQLENATLTKVEKAKAIAALIKG